MDKRKSVNNISRFKKTLKYISVFEPFRSLYSEINALPRV
jgi:hypothetical protein